MVLQGRLHAGFVSSSKMAAEVKKEPAAVIADQQAGDVFLVVFSVQGKELYTTLPFFHGEPFFVVVGFQGGREVGPFLSGTRCFLAVDDEAANGSHLMHPVVVCIATALS